MSTIDVGTNAPLAAGPDPGRRTVLVVDDSADMRSLLRDVLTREHCLVLTAASGQAALRAMARQRPDLVITDLFMPGMSGFSLRASMLQRPDLAAIPVIVLTAYWQRPGETLDAVAVFTKPVNLDRLVTAVRDVLRPIATADSHSRVERHASCRMIGRARLPPMGRRRYRRTTDEMQTAEAHAPARSPHDGPHILVVDDDDALREIYVDALTGSGYEARGAGDGRAALRLLEAGWTPCVVFLDLRMPGMDGWELARHIRANERWKDIRIVIVAAHFRIDREARELGAVAWLQKPFDLRVLEQQARRLCCA